MFHAYLKVAEHCNLCGEQLDLRHADDFPPYITILIVGHSLISLMLHLWPGTSILPYYLYTMVPLAVILPIALPPSIKCAIVGLQ
ncbi:MAG: DUF983 domain-containing protein [Candidatus Devosia symbiotica]|nr:DUF983 domain-containing protein [Candidatus Devosia symbiotica]